jgi:hypothetical protein
MGLGGQLHAPTAFATSSITPQVNSRLSGKPFRAKQLQLAGTKLRLSALQISRFVT